MNRLKHILVFCLTAACPAAMAQQDAARLAGNSIAVENKKVTFDNNNLIVAFDFNLDSLDLPSNMRLVFTPVVRDASNRIAMQPVVVNGRKQDISFKRFAHRQFPADAKVVRRHNGTAQTVAYKAVVPYEKWMANSNVEVEEDLCGCGDSIGAALVPVYRLRTPAVAFVRPEAAPKTYHLEGRAFIDFPVDKTVLYPDYRNNPSELQKIIATINTVKTDANATITSVEIHGYASPESPYSHNAYLAEHRAKTLKDYVRNLVALDDTVFTVRWTPEDWDGLRQFVSQSNLSSRQELLDIIDRGDTDPDRRELLIKTKYPADYRFLLATSYPALRHSDYVVNYSIRPFSVDEAKRLIYEKPQQLSLEEMFLVAQTFRPGSDEFNEVISIAVRMYPADPVANLNAACAEIEAGNFAEAEKYLAKAGDSPEADNARGVVAYHGGDEALARQLYSRAARGGVKAAADNLRNLENNY